MTHEQPEKTAGELRIELRQVRAAVKDVLEDYEQTAKSVDRMTAEISGIEATDHADNVETLKASLVEALDSDSDTIDPPWIREGYNSKQEWIDAN